MFDRIKKMFSRTAPIYPERFRFDRNGFPSCCQAKILHNLSYAGEVQGNSLSPELVGGMRQMLIGEEHVSGKLHMAITTDGQVTAETIFRETGFEAVHSWRALTGSYLTLWVYKP